MKEDMACKNTGERVEMRRVFKKVSHDIGVLCRRKRGRPSKGWKDFVKEDGKDKNINEVIAQSRAQWRSICVHNSVSFS